MQAAGAATAQTRLSHRAPDAPESGVIGFISNFESCPPACIDCDGWPNVCGLLVSSPPAHSGTNSVRLDGFALTDIIRPVGYIGGKFIITAWTYIQSSTAGDAYFIAFNTYDPGATCYEWALQVKFDSLFDTVSNDAGGFITAPMLPLIREQWVRYTAIVDLGADRYWDYYGSVPLTSEYGGMPLGWTSNNAFMGTCHSPLPTIAAVNLFTNGADGQLFDDVSVLCYADMSTASGIGTLDIFDFLAFQDRFIAGDITADCDISTGHGVLDLFDVLCFREAFLSGCG